MSKQDRPPVKISPLENAIVNYSSPAKWIIYSIKALNPSSEYHNQSLSERWCEITSKTTAKYERLLIAKKKHRHVPSYLSYKSKQSPCGRLRLALTNFRKFA